MTVIVFNRSRATTILVAFLQKYALHGNRDFAVAIGPLTSRSFGTN